MCHELMLFVWEKLHSLVVIWSWISNHFRFSSYVLEGCKYYWDCSYSNLQYKEALDAAVGLERFRYLLRRARTSSTTSSLKGAGSKPSLWRRVAHCDPDSWRSSIWEESSQARRLIIFRAQVRSSIRRSLLARGKLSSKLSNRMK